MAKRVPWVQAAMLGLESAQVMGLRLMKLAKGGPAARSETSRMISEKATAGLGAFGTIMTGGSLGKVVSDYRKKVKANRKRLSP